VATQVATGDYTLLLWSPWWQRATTGFCSGASRSAWLSKCHRTNSDRGGENEHRTDDVPAQRCVLRPQPTTPDHLHAIWHAHRQDL